LLEYDVLGCGVNGAALYFSLVIQRHWLTSFVRRLDADDDNECTKFIIEATDSFKERYRLLMATSLVSINNGITC
jgi:hypothetical protein